MLRLVLEMIHITVTHNSHCEGTKEHMHHLPIFANYHKMALSLLFTLTHYREKGLQPTGERICWIVASQGASLTWQVGQSSGSWR